MSISVVKKKKHKGEFSRWDEAIGEAKKRIKDLKFTIKVYEERRDRNEPWPGSGEPHVPSVTPLHQQHGISPLPRDLRICILSLLVYYLKILICGN